MTYRGPRGHSYPVGESGPTMVGERPHEPPQDRHHEDRPREQQAKRLGW